MGAVGVISTPLSPCKRYALTDVSDDAVLAEGFK